MTQLKDLKSIRDLKHNEVILLLILLLVLIFLLLWLIN